MEEDVIDIIPTHSFVTLTIRDVHIEKCCKHKRIMI